MTPASARDRLLIVRGAADRGRGRDGAGVRWARVRLSTSLRALLGFVYALVLVDTLFFTALPLLLPHYMTAAGLTKFEVSS